MLAKRPDGQGRQPRTKRTPRLFLWAALGAMVAIGLVFVWRIVQGDNADDGQPKEPERKKSIKTAPASPSPAHQQEAPTAAKKQVNEDAERERRREMFGKMSAEEKIEYLRERIRNMPIPETPTNRLYATGIEQAMDWIFSCKVGDPPPLLPPMSLFDQMHLAEILIMDNPIRETDSDKAVESKEMMKIAKKEFMKFIKDGGNPDEFLPYYHGQLVAAHDEYAMARQSVVEVIRNEPDIAIDYIKKVNARLSEKGIKNVNVPKKMLDAFGIDSEDFE